MNDKDSTFRPLEGLKPDDGRLAPAEDISGGQTGPAVRTEGLSAEANRGRRAPQDGSGVVIGSGASAGGGGGAEDFDPDSASGGGANEARALSGAPDPTASRRGAPQATPAGKNAEDWQPEDESPLDPPGVSGGTAGTGGDNKVQNDLAR